VAAVAGDVAVVADVAANKDAQGNLPAVRNRVRKNSGAQVPAAHSLAGLPLRRRKFRATFSHPRAPRTNRPPLPRPRH
jgi:hypothetical protein